MALDPDAARGADDEFYQHHTELVSDGRRVPLSSGMDDYEELRAEWQDLYRAHLTRGNGSRTAVRPAAGDRYIGRTSGTLRGAAVQGSLKSHAFVIRTSQLIVDWRWPLAGYYVYLDTDLGDGIDFDTLGLLWTDEKGGLHLTGGDGKPTQPLSHFPLAWSTDQAEGIMSVALIYDYDRDRLEKRKQGVQQEAKRSAVASRYRITPGRMLIIPDVSDSGQGALLSIIVPRDNEVLAVDRLKALMDKCDKGVQAAHDAQKQILDFVKYDEERQVMYFYREQVNDWLGPDGSERRRHLSTVNPTTTIWEQACRNFDHALQRLLEAYDRALDPLYDILTDDQQRQDLGDIGVVLEGWEDPAGEHLLWRHQFLMEACGLFCGTLRQQEIFTKIVQPMLQGLSYAWSDLRVACKCATCQSMIKDKTTSATQPMKDLLGHVGWKAKDLKIGTSTVLRVLDLFTKFAPNWAHILATSPSPEAWRDIGLISYNLFIRAGVIGPGGLAPEMAEKWMSLWGNMSVSAKKAEGSLERFVNETLKFLHPNLQKGTEDILKRVGDSFNLVGAGIVVYCVVTKEGKLNVKDAMDLGRAISDATKAGMGLGKKRLEAALVAKLGAEAGKKWAAALPKYVGVAGGCFQVASAWIGLQDAANKGDRRSFGWAAVQYTGADISLAGLALDVMPEPIVTKGSGLVLNFVGGVVYLVGQVGEFVTRPGAEELFLRTHYLYEDKEHWRPGEKEAYDRQQQEERNRMLEEWPYPGP